MIVGAGQVVHRTGEPGLSGPVELPTESLRRAGADSGTGDRLLRSADLIAGVAAVSRPYSDLGALIAAGLGATPKRTHDPDRNRIIQHRWRNAVRILLGKADPDTLTEPRPAR